MYTDLNITVSKEKRQEYNEKILSDIFSNTQLIPKNEVFNLYSGIGGLHDLDFKDFDSYYSFSEEKKKIEQGQFFTPPAICEKLVSLFQISKNDYVADFCCGSGNFFNYLPNLSNVFGCEIEENAFNVAKYLYSDANIVCDDFRYLTPPKKYDFVFGNPPFNLAWRSHLVDDKISSQLYYIIHSSEHLKNGGLMAVIVPQSLGNDEFFKKSEIEAINNNLCFLGQCSLDSNTFKDLGVASFNTKIMVFYKKNNIAPVLKYENVFLSFSELLNKIKEYQSFFTQNKSLFLLDQVKNNLKTNDFSFSQGIGKETEEKAFDFVIKKYLFELKAHKYLSEYYQKCLSYLDQYVNQKPPVNTNQSEREEWEKNRIKKSDVLRYFKKYLRLKQKPQTDTCRLVKTSYGIKTVFDSAKIKKIYKQQNIEQIDFDFNSLISDIYFFNNRRSLLNKNNFIGMFSHCINKKEIIGIYRLFIQKYNAFVNNETILKELPKNESINEFLSNYRFNNKKGKNWSLNSMQIEDTARFIQKPYNLMNYQQGGGKTPCTYALALYRLKHNFIKNVFIVSGGLAISVTWTDFLTQNNASFVVIKNNNDILKIKKGDFVLISTDFLIRIQKQLKTYVKQISQNALLIFDESDEMTNANSQRTRASQNVFSKLKYKTLATGTTTRNNINEIYSQLELLYNNSINMLCTVVTRYREVKEDKSIKSFENESHYYKPFCAKHGLSVFISCFNPSKKTVFGIEKNNQDVFNSKELIHILEKTLITRKFKDIAGDKYTIHNCTVKQSHEEKQIYKAIIEELNTLMPYFYSSTGNCKKDAMLRIIRQLQLLIKACTVPFEFPNYSRKNITPKAQYIIDFLNKKDNQKVAIGCTFKSALSYYNELIFTYCPFRPVFIIDGEDSFPKRQKIISQFENTVNGILICTQQSLKNSVNIPSCKNVILESLQWNAPKMEQFYFRFIRFDSVGNTDVHFVTYENTIEQNILALIMAKERINDFIKCLEYKEESDIFDEFGIEYDIFQSILKKEKDEEGHFQISWGEQFVN